MPKMKTHKGSTKRFRVTAKGKVRHRKPNAGHLMSGKSGDRRRDLRKPAYLKGKIAQRVKLFLGEG